MKSPNRAFVVVTTTVDSKAKAKELALAIVARRLAACVQYTGIRSVYRWKGRIESAAEQLLLAKTTRSGADRLIGFIRKNHSYELPEITVQPISGGLAGYLDWIDTETSVAKKTHK
ncbi:MAG: divalent-cation tolerance protein CutA [bacterium]